MQIKQPSLLITLLRNSSKPAHDYSTAALLLNTATELCVFMCLFLDKNEFSFMLPRIKREISRKIKSPYGGKKSLNMVFKILFCSAAVCHIGLELDIVTSVVCFKS